MAYEKTIERIRGELTSTFDSLDQYFDLANNLRIFSPAADVWSIDQILEHITLTNHFLMITLKHSRDRVIRRAKTQVPPEGESDLDKIVRIGDPDAFAWVRPEHMEPSGTQSSDEIRRLLKSQRQECLQILNDLEGGKGVLHTIRMSVQDLGRLDLYQWLYFLVQHAHRHNIEIERLQALYRPSGTNQSS